MSQNATALRTVLGICDCIREIHLGMQHTLRNMRMWNATATYFQEMRSGDALRRCAQDLRSGDALRICAQDMRSGHALGTCAPDMRLALGTCARDMRSGHATALGTALGTCDRARDLRSGLRPRRAATDAFSSASIAYRFAVEEGGREKRRGCFVYKLGVSFRFYWILSVSAPHASFDCDSLDRSP
jgi:hypothetical protein